MYFGLVILHMLVYKKNLTDSSTTKIVSFLLSIKEEPVRQKPHRTRTWYLVGMDTVGVPLHAGCTRFSPKKKISGTGLVRVGYGSGMSRVGSDTGRDKTKPKRLRFRVNLKPYLSSPPDSQPLVLFSAT